MKMDYIIIIDATHSLSQKTNVLALKRWSYSCYPHNDKHSFFTLLNLLHCVRYGTEDLITHPSTEHVFKVLLRIWN